MANFAVYGAETPGHVKFTLRLPSTFDLERLLKGLRDELGGPVGHRLHGTHVVLSIPAESAALARRALTAFEEVAIVGAGRRMEIFKEVGRPDDVSRKFGLDTMSGTHAVGHTRMATESAVTTNGAHPLRQATTTRIGQCSLSNHCAVRRELIKKGVVPGGTTRKSRPASSPQGEGRRLLQRGDGCLDSLDGFYTFVIGPEGLRGFAIRSPASPRWSPRTDRLVAFGPNTARLSIYRGSLPPKCGAGATLFTAGNCINAHCRSTF